MQYNKYMENLFEITYTYRYYITLTLLFKRKEKINISNERRNN